MSSEIKLVELATQLAKTTGISGNVPAGGDDCVVLPVGRKTLVGLSIDTVNMHPLFRCLNIGSAYDYGYLCACANISDVLGSGFLPRVFVMALGVPDNENSDQVVTDICSGAAAVCRTGGVIYAGGDTKKAAILNVTGCCIGVSRSRAPRLRSAAKVGEDVLISGPIGQCAAGALVLSREHCFDTPTKQWAVEAVLRPSLPWGAAKVLYELGSVGGGIDISDGLGIDLHRLADASGVGLEIHADLLPQSEFGGKIAATLGISKTSVAFGLAGDWQFIATCRPEETKQIVRECPQIRCIGRVISAREGDILIEDGIAKPLPHHGHIDFEWDDFLSRLKLFVFEQSRMISKNETLDSR